MFARSCSTQRQAEWSHSHLSLDLLRAHCSLGGLNLSGSGLMPPISPSMRQPFGMHCLYIGISRATCCRERFKGSRMLLGRYGWVCVGIAHFLSCAVHLTWKGPADTPITDRRTLQHYLTTQAQPAGGSAAATQVFASPSASYGTLTPYVHRVFKSFVSSS